MENKIVDHSDVRMEVDSSMASVNNLTEWFYEN